MALARFGLEYLKIQNAAPADRFVTPYIRRARAKRGATTRRKGPVTSAEKAARSTAERAFETLKW